MERRQMISFQILKEIQRVCDDKKINHRELAQMIGTSEGFVSQLFSGKRILSLKLIGKLEEVLGVTFITLAVNDK
jgi:transcriptional regulator with XRE-family HTH domain